MLSRLILIIIQLDLNQNKASPKNHAYIEKAIRSAIFQLVYSRSIRRDIAKAITDVANTYFPDRISPGELSKCHKLDRLNIMTNY